MYPRMAFAHVSRSHSCLPFSLPGSWTFSVSINAGYLTNYVGFGLKKAFAKDAAANYYLVVNQVILPPPLTPDSEGGENYI